MRDNYWRDLGARAKAAGMPLKPGMVIAMKTRSAMVRGGDWTQSDVCLDNIVTYWTARQLTHAVPDLRHAGTLGYLLRLVGVLLIDDDKPARDWSLSCDPYDGCVFKLGAERFYGATDAEALVKALEWVVSEQAAEHSHATAT